MGMPRGRHRHPSSVSVCIAVAFCFVTRLHICSAIKGIPQMQKPQIKPVQPVPKKHVPVIKAKRVVAHGEEFALGDRQLNEFPVWYASIPTFGQVWPKPLFEDRKERVFHLKNSSLTFKITQAKSDVLSKAVLRTKLIISEKAVSVAPTTVTPLLSSASLPMLLERITITCYKVGEKWPHLGMDESYSLEANPNGIMLFANEQWGILRGLETLTQLIWQDKNGELFLNEITIRDKPTFPHRGMLVDTARHYLSKKTILKNLDAMAMNKMNVMHWHIVDDQSFPYQSKVYPDLSKKGAYDPEEKIYTHDDIKEIVAYARLLGIRVIPEFDSPSHTFSWGSGYPELLTECFVNGISDGVYGPLDPSKTFTFEFLKNLFKEIVLLFPETFIHLGTDEVGNTCWLSNPSIQKLMNRLKLSSGAELSKYYVKKLQTIIYEIEKETRRPIHSIFWQETLKLDYKFMPGTVVQLWTYNINEVADVASKGQRVLYSSCWYLDNVKFWTSAYTCELGNARAAWRKNLLGGEACMWAEKVNDMTMLTKSWPVASAAAERLWSPEVDNLEAAGARLEEQRCRMNMRDIPTGVTNPGSCRTVRGRSHKPLNFFSRSSMDIFSTGRRQLLFKAPDNYCSWIMYIIVLAVFLYILVYFKRNKLHVRLNRCLTQSISKHRPFLLLCFKWSIVGTFVLIVTFLLV